MEWTAEAIDHLRSLWGEGHSTAEIGRRMGISKNAVVGKAHRLNLPARPSPIRREGMEPGAALPRRAPAQAPRPAMQAPPRRMQPMLPAAANAPAAAPQAPRPPQPGPASSGGPAAATAARALPASGGSVVRPFPRASARSCAWPMGEPGTPEFRFCGCDAMPAKPYCAEHAAIAYVKVRDRREDAA